MGYSYSHYHTIPIIIAVDGGLSRAKIREHRIAELTRDSCSAALNAATEAVKGMLTTFYV